MSLSAEQRARLQGIRLLCLDVDGVLTDGNLYWSPGGIWSQRFSVRDGYGIKLLQDAGVEVAILSGGDVQSGRDRAQSLGITRAHFGIADKPAVFRDVAGALGLKLAGHYAEFVRNRERLAMARYEIATCAISGPVGTFASVDPRNARSIALMERLGFRREAHFVESLWFKEAWADDVIFAMLEREWQ